MTKIFGVRNDEVRKENPKIESKGFCDAVTVRDFPIRDKGVDLIVRRRKWYDRQTNRYFSDSYDLKAEGTRYSKEFAAFLKGVSGDDPYDLPFAWRTARSTRRPSRR